MLLRSECIAIYIFLVCHVYGVQIQIGGGKLEGKQVEYHNQEVMIFKGVPFAEPPLKDLRFQAPLAKSPWTGVWNSTFYRPACMSNSSFTRSPQKSQSEDCLYANIFADKRCLIKLCPVMVIIHPGSFTYDSAVMYNVPAIIKKYASKEMVVVIPAYRLGIFGLLDLGRPLETAPYNVAVLDIIHALKWVNREIGAFGGDSKRVTIFGNSAGGDASVILAMSPAITQDLFSQHIIVSAAVRVVEHVSLNISREISDYLGCSNSTTLEEELKCLREVPSKELVDAQHLKEYNGDLLGPQVDNITIMWDTWTNNNSFHHPKPALIITTYEEAGFADNQTVEQKCEQEITAFGFNEQATYNKCLERYSTVMQIEDCAREAYHAFAVNIARMTQNRGQNAYVGIFAQANHSHHHNDINYSLDMKPITNETTNDLLMKSFFTDVIRRFVKTGVPYSDWPTVDSTGQNYYWLDIEIVKTMNETTKVPKAVKGSHFDEEGVHFYLTTLAQVELDAKENNMRFIRDVFEDNDSNTVTEVNLVSERDLALENVTVPFDQATTQKTFDDSLLWSRYVSFLTVFVLVLVIVTIIGTSRALYLFFSHRYDRESAEKNLSELKRILKEKPHGKGYGLIDE